jgi:hypothetical protein
VTISAAASDNIGVAGVKFMLDGALLGTELLASPYQVVWSTLHTSNGTHVLTAIARDAAGNMGGSQVVVTVQNVTPPRWIRTPR